MKKTLAAVAVLGAFAGSALAADVTLYGRIDTGFNFSSNSISVEDISHSLWESAEEVRICLCKTNADAESERYNDHCAVIELTVFEHLDSFVQD